MRCNPLRWLWGLIPIAMLALLANQWERPRIENDLTQRAKAELARQGLDWADVKFHGRNAIVTGRAGDEGEPKLAGEKVRNVWGVYATRLDTDLIATVSKYTWQAERDGKKVTLTGHVPTEQARRTILAQVKDTFGTVDIDDQMKPARGAPKPDLWLAGTGYALKQLALLKGGSVSLEPMGFSIAGEAADSGSYKSLKSTIPGGIPSGWSLASEKIAPPVAEPFTWNAKLAGNQLVLSGHVPSEAVREDIFARAKKAFPKYAVIDRTELASGAPADIQTAMVASLDQLYQLKQGSADIKDKALHLAGIAEDGNTADSVRSALKKSAPSSFKTTDAITFDMPRLARVATFTTDIAATPDSIEITGYVPSEEARKNLLDALRNAFFGRRIVDKTEIADGAPTAWFTCAAAGVSSLARLGAGKASLSGSAIEVSGKTGDGVLAAAIPGELAAAGGRACETTANIAVDQPSESYLWWYAENNGSTLTLWGEAPDAASRTALAATAASLFPGLKIEDNSAVVSRRSTKWAPVTDKALKLLSQLKSGSASLFRDEVAVRGEAANDGVRHAVEAGVSGELPAGFSGRPDIWITPAVDTAAEDATRKAAEEAAARRKAEEDAAAAKRKADEDARQAAEAAAAAEARRKAEAAAAAAAAAAQAAAEDEARRKAEADAAAKAAAEEDARRKAEADAAAKAAAEAEAARKAKQEADDAAAKAASADRKAREEAAGRCQKLVRDTAAAGKVLFQWASDKLDDKSTPTLKKVAKIMLECPGTRIEIGGHTSADGDPTRNQNLSERRARAVADVLIKAGVAADRVTAAGYGFSKPIAPNDSEANRAKNRRIEFSVIAN